MFNPENNLMNPLSVVIATYNSSSCIRQCLYSVINQDFRGLEVIVVDNGSKDGTPGLIRSFFPQVKLIENPVNKGASEARNQGIEVSSGKWAMTLDCDAYLETGFFLNLLRVIDKVPETIGAIQPKILNEHSTAIFSAGIFLSALRRFYDMGQGEPGDGRFVDSRPVFGVCAAAGVYRRIMLEDVKEKTGYFDERFFFLVEDVDLSWRAQRKGWQAMFYPQLVCYHRTNSSNTDRSTRKYLCFRNRLYMIAKNESLLGKLALIPFLVVYDLPRLLAFSLKGKGFLYAQSAVPR